MTKSKHTLWNIWNIVVALLFVTIGVLTCAFSGDKDFQNTIILIVGIVLLVIAGLQIGFQILRIILAGDETTVSADLSIAGVTASELALGIVAILVSKDMTSASAVFKYLGYFLGIVLLSVGGLLIIYEIVFLVRKKHKLPLGIATIIGALVPIALGIVVLVFLNDQDRFLTFVFVCIGIIFILLGLGYLALTILKIRKERAEAKLVVEEKPAEEPVEAPAVEEPAAPAEPEEPKAEEPEVKEPEPEEPEEEPKPEEGEEKPQE